MNTRDWQLDLGAVAGMKNDTKRLRARTSGCFFLGELLVFDKPELVRVVLMVAGGRLVSSVDGDALEIRDFDKAARLDRWREPLWPADEVEIVVKFLSAGRVSATIFGAAISTTEMFPAVGAAFAERIAQTKAPL